MLVLTRRQGEKIIINGNITVLIVEISPTNVRLGIEAPKEMSVDREEIYNDKRRNGKNNP